MRSNPPAPPPRGSTVLVTGSSGFLGHALAAQLAGEGWRTVAAFLTTAPDLPPAIETVPVDLTDGGAVGRLLRDLRPAAVIHAAALTDGGACERQPTEAWAANVTASVNVARAVARQVPEARLIGISTDLVFDGTGAPYAEDAVPRPLSVYGLSKLAAEAAIRALPGGTVLRVPLLFGAEARGRGGFLGWMRRTLAAGRPLALYEDEFRTPASTACVAAAVARLLELEAPGDLYHAPGPERLSRLEMGRVLCAAEGYDPSLLRAVRLADSRPEVPRPPDVSLAGDLLRHAIGWRPVSLSEFLGGRSALPSSTNPSR